MTDPVPVLGRCPWCGYALREPVGSLGQEGPTCPDCGRSAVVPAYPFSGVYDVVEYDFDDVTPAERAEATDLLVNALVPYRWDDGYRLLVPPDREEEVDVLFGHIAPHAPLEISLGPVNGTGDASATKLDGDGGMDEPVEWVKDEQSAAALADLFDAADRLRHHPDNEDAAAALADATGVVMIAPVPFGVNEVLWRTAGQLARQLVELLDERAGSDDIVAAADVLRAILRDHI